MSLYLVSFYVFAALTLSSAVFIMFTKNVLHATFSLILSFLGLAALYVLAAAEFIAVTQLVVYVGGVLVLMVFGIMLTNKVSGKVLISEGHNRLTGVLAGVGLFIVLFVTIVKINFSSLTWISDQKQIVDGPQIQRIGILLMTDYLLPFEIAGVLLLIMLIGAVYIADWKSDKL